MTAPIDMQPICGGRYTVCKAGGRRPQVGHDTFSAAEAEASRLVAATPGAVFIINQEVARVRGGPQGSSS